MADIFSLRNNITAMYAQRHSALANAGTRESVNQLSSGYRVKRGADDAASLAVSEKMRTQIRGAQQARRNAQDAVSFMRAAESSLQEATDIVQRMRELCIQAANDTYSTSDRSLLQTEIDQFKEQLDSNAVGAEFSRHRLNGMVGDHESANLDLKTLDSAYVSDGAGDDYDGNGDGTADYTAEAVEKLKEKISYWVDYGARMVWGRTGMANNGSNGIAPDAPINVFLEENETAMNAATGQVGAAAAADGTNLYINLQYFLSGNEIATRTGSQATLEQIVTHEVTHILQDRNGTSGEESWFTEGQADFASLNLDLTTPDTDGIATPAGAGVFAGGTADAAEGAWSMRYISEVYGSTTLRNLYNQVENGTSAQTAVVNAVNSAGRGPRVADFAEFDSNYQSWMRDFAAPQMAGQMGVDFHGMGNTSTEFKPMANLILDMHIGASKDQKIEAQTYLTTGGGLDYISFVNVRDRQDAERSIDTIDNVLNILSRERGLLGATSEHLEHMMNSISQYGDRIQRAESIIRDTDMAGEITEMTRNQVMMQGANAMLAQANIAPSNVLSLLG